MSQILQFAIVFIAIIVLVWAGYAFFNRSRRPKEEGFQYVYVNEDGSVRQLSQDEREYLSTEFDPTDGNRPYIKFHFNSKTPDKSISGFIERRQVPAKIRIL